MAKLRSSMTPPPAGAAGLNDPETLARLQRYLLEEISGKTTQITGPGAGDARALSVAVSVLRLFKPTLMGVVLQNADIAHGSYNGYLEVIRRNDQEVGALWDAVQRDFAMNGNRQRGERGAVGGQQVRADGGAAHAGDHHLAHILHIR